MVSHSSGKCVSLWIQLSDLLYVYVTRQRIVQRPQERGQMHTSISTIQLFGMFMIHVVSAGQLVGIDFRLPSFLQKVLTERGKQRGCGDYCRWGAVGTRTFPLIKKEHIKSEYLQPVNVRENHKVPP